METVEEGMPVGSSVERATSTSVEDKGEAGVPTSSQEEEIGGDVEPSIACSTTTTTTVAVSSKSRFFQNAAATTRRLVKKVKGISQRLQGAMRPDNGNKENQCHHENDDGAPLAKRTKVMGGRPTVFTLFRRTRDAGSTPLATGSSSSSSSSWQSPSPAPPQIQVEPYTDSLMPPTPISGISLHGQLNSGGGGGGATASAEGGCADKTLTKPCDDIFKAFCFEPQQAGTAVVTTSDVRRDNGTRKGELKRRRLSSPPPVGAWMEMYSFHDT